MKRFFFFFIISVLLLSSCKWTSDSWFNEHESNTEEKIHRYDRIVDEFVSLNSYSALQRLNLEYPKPTRLLIEDVLGIGLVDDARIEQRLREYFMDSTMQVLLEDVHRKYADMKAEERELYAVFHKIHAVDSTFSIPLIYTQISGLNQSIVVGDSLLGISLDKYLGKDYPLYKRYYYDWQYNKMDRSRIVPDALYYYISHEYPLPHDRVHTLLDYMVDYGKIHWVIAHCRGTSMTREMGFDEKRVAWYRSNEGYVWRWLLLNNALMSADRTMIKRFFQPRPNTLYLGSNSPDQIGLWLGMQIVSRYMENHPNKTMKDLLLTTDYRKILEESGYSPR